MEKPCGICLGIVGSRNYTDKADFTRRVDEWVKKNGMPSVIVSGGAKGADTMAEEYADERKVSLEVLPPDYNTYGKNATFQRNQQIAMLCTHLLAFPSHHGSGTQDTIKKAQRLKKKVEIQYIDEPDKTKTIDKFFKKSSGSTK